MNPVHPWLDADEVKQLAEQLMRPPPAQETRTEPNTGYGTEFVGFAGDEPTPAPPDQLITPIPLPSPVATPLPANPPAAPATPPPAPVSPAPASPVSPFLKSIRQYRDWMHSKFSATGLFLLDHQGIVIFDEGTHGRLHFLARSLALASRRPDTAATYVHLKISVGATLEVIPVDTAIGSLFLGAVVPHALSQDAVRIVTEELIHAVRQADPISAPAPPSGSPAASAHPPA